MKEFYQPSSFKNLVNVKQKCHLVSQVHFLSNSFFAYSPLSCTTNSSNVITPDLQKEREKSKDRSHNRS